MVEKRRDDYNRRLVYEVLALDDTFENTSVIQGGDAIQYGIEHWSKLQLLRNAFLN